MSKDECANGEVAVTLLFFNMPALFRIDIYLKKDHTIPKHPIRFWDLWIDLKIWDLKNEQSATSQPDFMNDQPASQQPAAIWHRISVTAAAG
jgi:hypothetical protein